MMWSVNVVRQIFFSSFSDFLMAIIWFDISRHFAIKFTDQNTFLIAVSLLRSPVNLSRRLAALCSPSWRFGRRLVLKSLQALARNRLPGARVRTRQQRLWTQSPVMVSNVLLQKKLKYKNGKYTKKIFVMKSFQKARFSDDAGYVNTRSPFFALFN